MLKTTMKIDGMMCSMCESHVNDAVRHAFGSNEIKKVSSSHTKGETEIISEASLDEAKLRKAVEDTGYKVLSVESSEYEKKGLFGGLFKK